MNAKLRWLWRFSALAALGLAAFGIYEWREQRAFFEPARLLSRFPAEDAAVVSADFDSVRQAGLLASSKMALEPEYKQFLDATGFDYRRDLRHLTAAFSASGNYFIAQGSFDWARLRAYAVKQGGTCYQDLCRLQGSTPERHISFMPLRRDALALAVSTNDLAASRLVSEGQRVAASLPSAPVWISFPGRALKSPGLLPGGIRLMLSALVNADRVVITLNQAGSGMEARLDSTCRSVDEARVLSSQLRIVASTLQKSADDELARALASGSFAQSERVVTARWPLGKSAMDALTGGI